MLVDPVRGERGDDVLPPPVVGAHLVDPAPARCSSRRGRRGRRRSSPSRASTAASGSPARSSSRDRAACTPRSRRTQLARRLARVATAVQERVRGGRDLVGVDLVADHQQHVGPALARLGRACAPRACAASRPLCRARPRPCAGSRAARAGPPRGRSRTRPRAARPWGRCGRRSAESPRLGPDALAVEADLVLVPRARLQALAADQRVVVARHAEGALARAQHLHLARTRSVSTQIDRLGLSHVTQKGA